MVSCQIKTKADEQYSNSVHIAVGGGVAPVCSAVQAYVIIYLHYKIKFVAT